MSHPYQDIRHVEINNVVVRAPLHYPVRSTNWRINNKASSICYLTAISISTAEEQQQVISYYRRILREQPHDHMAAFNLGLLYYQGGEYFPAYACFQMASRYAPEDIQSIYHLGATAFQLQDYSTALDHFLQTQQHPIFEQLPEETRLNVKLYIANINLLLNNIEQAAEIYMEVAEEKSHGQLTAVNQLINLFLNRHNNFQLAEQWIDLALTLDSHAIVPIKNKIIILKAKGKLQEALPLLLDLIKLEPHNSEAFYDLACLHSERKEEYKTKHNLEKAIHLNPITKSYASRDIDFAHYFSSAWFKQLVN